MKNLIIYFSRRGQNYVNGEIENLAKGNTERVVDYIREAVDADVFEIRTVKKYPEDYLACTEEAQKEQRRNERPELLEYLDDVSGYDNIIVAAPCWWGTCPYAMLTQLERLDLKGKRIFPVMTHEGSSLGNFPKTLKKSCKGAKIQRGLAVHGAEVTASEEVIKRWAKRNLA